MRWLGFLLIVASLVACSSEEDELTHTSLYLLPDGRIQVGDVVSEPQAVVGCWGRLLLLKLISWPVRRQASDQLRCCWQRCRKPVTRDMGLPTL